MIKTLEDFDFKEKKVFVRVDFNVPLDEKGRVKEDDRIASALPTVKRLLDGNCKIVLASHLGRPKGKVVERLRMGAVAERLEKLLERKVTKLDDCIGEKVEKAVSEMRARDVILLENLRFHPEEEANDESFAEKLASLADFYVNDAFGASHRTHASVVAIAKFLPSCAGFLLEAEVKTLDHLLKNPEKPFVAIIGGVKISDKLVLVKNLLKKVDKLLIGGAMAFTFIKSEGHGVGKSLVEDGFVDKAREILKSGKVVLPVDIVEASECKHGARNQVVSSDKVDPNRAGFDIGPETIKKFKEEIDKASAVVWNGPMGVFEIEAFDKGTKEIAKHVSSSQSVTVIGGGDTLAAAKKSGVYGKFSHTSTGGGAMLEFLEGKKLPAIESLEN